MKLTRRDSQIIEFISNNKGATIEQLEKLFFPSYISCSKRLKILCDNEFIKVGIQPVIGKKVYYDNKIPSYHSLIFTDLLINMNEEISFAEREYKIKNVRTDGIIILKKGKIIIVEIDLFNRTSDKKLIDIQNQLNTIGTDYMILIISRCKRKKGINKLGDNIKNIGIEEVKDVYKIINNLHEK